MIKRCSAILLCAALLWLMMVSSAASYDSLPKSNGLTPTIYLEIDQVGERINATIWLENVSARFVQMDVKFNPTVVQLIDVNGNPVISRTKDNAMINNGLAGLTPGQALGNGNNPQFWNGWFFTNDNVPRANNSDGYYRLVFGTNGVRSIERESLLTLHFEVIGAGNSGISFANSSPWWQPLYIGEESEGLLRVLEPRLMVLDSCRNEVTGENITQLASREEVYAVFFDRPDSFAGTQLIITVFDNGRFYDVDISETYQTASVRLPTDVQNATVKVFVWDDLGNMNPEFERLVIGGENK